MKFESKANEFTRITIVIPLSSSIMQGLLVTIGDQIFAIPSDFIETTDEASCILIVNANNKRAALLVDSLLDQTDMVIKPKHSIMMDINEIKGTTILGDGLVTLVLDIPSILKEI